MTSPTYDSASRIDRVKVLTASKAGIVIDKLGGLAGSICYMAGSALDGVVWVAQRPGALVSTLQKLHEGTPPWISESYGGSPDDSENTTDVD